MLGAKTEGRQHDQDDNPEPGQRLGPAHAIRLGNEQADHERSQAGIPITVTTTPNQKSAWLAGDVPPAGSSHENSSHSEGSSSDKTAGRRQARTPRTNPRTTKAVSEIAQSEMRCSKKITP